MKRTMTICALVAAMAAAPLLAACPQQITVCEPEEKNVQYILVDDVCKSVDTEHIEGEVVDVKRITLNAQRAPHSDHNIGMQFDYELIRVMVDREIKTLIIPQDNEIFLHDVAGFSYIQMSSITHQQLIDLTVNQGIPVGGNYSALDKERIIKGIEGVAYEYGVLEKSQPWLTE
ncbi:hypothetical protein KY320_01630 [Candidatus Woesearchaeota archaeon]|nr:hypothetical protein [Candidatus Woesearchaeota archaeon]